MHVPPHFAVSDPATLHDFIERHSFGLLISQIGGAPFATHLPFLLERDAGPHGALVGHLARANPQWRELTGQAALAVFSGPHAYISPGWYEAENVVPTWDYAAVHATGRVALIEDRGELLAVLGRSVEQYESAMPRPWRFDAAGDFAGRMLGGIVGFRLTIDRIEGQWKMSQNHPAERREKVIRALRERGGDDADGVAEMIGAMLSGKG